MELPREFDCAVCFDNKVSSKAVFCVQCNRSICVDCAKNIDNCPYCRYKYNKDDPTSDHKPCCVCGEESAIYAICLSCFLVGKRGYCCIKCLGKCRCSMCSGIKHLDNFNKHYDTEVMKFYRMVQQYFKYGDVVYDPMKKRNVCSLCIDVTCSIMFDVYEGVREILKRNRRDMLKDHYTQARSAAAKTIVQNDKKRYKRKDKRERLWVRVEEAFNLNLFYYKY
jgi:hypothetical protein